MWAPQSAVTHHCDLGSPSAQRFRLRAAWDPACVCGWVRRAFARHQCDHCGGRLWIALVRRPRNVRVSRVRLHGPRARLVAGHGLHLPRLLRWLLLGDWCQGACRWGLGAGAHYAAMEWAPNYPAWRPEVSQEVEPAFFSNITESVVGCFCKAGITSGRLICIRGRCSLWPATSFACDHGVVEQALWCLFLIHTLCERSSSTHYNPAYLQLTYSP